MTPPSHSRFDALDGMRGLAALFVMVYHVSKQNGLHLARGSYAAVDLFFILSGFVIMHSYGRAILGGMGFGEYLKARLIRLAPLYLVGLALGFTAMMVTVLYRPHGDLTVADVWRAGGLALAGLPYLNGLTWPLGHQLFLGPIFPLNGPSWSLFFELMVNIVFFFYLLRLRQVRAWHVGVLMAVLLAIELHTGEMNAGWGQSNFWLGFPRVAAEFLLGALLYVWYPRWKLLFKPLQLALIAAVFALFLSSSERKVLLDALVLSPLAILAGAHLQLGEHARAVCRWLGELSYPIYVVHVPLHALAIACFGLEQLPPLPQLLIVVVAAVLSAIVLNQVDARVRKALKARLLPRASQPGRATA
ncbi:MAG: acyltransferase [Aquabacterium sp.]